MMHQDPPRHAARDAARGAASARGAVGVSAVIALVVIQLLVVAVVVAGARDLDVTVQRIDGLRSFYAVESGVNMAIREFMKGVDEDNDGAIGSISDDGNAANDPALVNARLTVVENTTTADTVLDAIAWCGESRRRVQVSITGGGGGAAQTIVCCWGRSGSSQPRYSVWNPTTSTWSASAAMPTVGGNIKWVRMKICPLRNETAFVAEDEGDDVNIEFYNATANTWTNAVEVSSDTGGTNDRPEDVAYEQVSGDAISVYWKGTVSQFGYRTYNGTSFSSESLLSSPFSTENDYLTLYARAKCDEVMLLAADGNAGGPLVSAYWNGSTFSGWTTICSALTSNNEECYSMAWEAQTRRGVAVYSQSGQTAPRYRTWNGSAWSAEANLPSVGGVPLWIRLAADPTTNKILMVCLDNQNDINACLWDGTSWGSVIELEANCAANDRRQFDVVFERGTGQALLVYGESGQNSPRYRTFNGTSWSAELTGPNIGARTEIVHLARAMINGEVFVAISDNNRDLQVIKWNGASMGSSSILETNLAGTAAQQSFSLPEPTPQAHPRMITWKEMPPW